MQTCFEWFTKGISDLEQDTQLQLFQKELLKVDPATLSQKGNMTSLSSLQTVLYSIFTLISKYFFVLGFACFKCFFENVNIFEHKLKKPGMVSLGLL